MQRPRWEDGNKRRNLGKLTVNERKANKMKPFNSVVEEEQGPPSRTRARVKRKLEDLSLHHSVTTKTQAKQVQGSGNPNHKDQPANSDQAVVKKAKESPKHDDHATCTAQGQTSIEPIVPPLPEKKTLELILDVLQRRDTYEIFAEPVDQKEVEDYYDIIEEPMDFGTMRAKLHEGMYKTLEQFERDVFLISRNAMYFNSSSTIYFRQARAIHELAKNVFHVLKTDPVNFVSKFSGTRQRSCRRSQGEGKDLNLKSCPRTSRILGPGSANINVSLKGTPCRSGPSTFKRNIRGNPGVADYDFFSGNLDGRNPSSAEEDRRSTYGPWMFFPNENDSIVPNNMSDSRPLSFVDQMEFSYSESLMSFVKDLGPTAQMIAKRKLQGLPGYSSSLQTPISDMPIPTHQISATFPFAQSKPSTQDTISTTGSSQKLTGDISTTGASQKLTGDISTTDASQKLTGDIIDLTDADDGEKAYYSRERVGKLDDKMCPFNNNGTMPTAEHSQSNVSEFKLENTNSSFVSSWISQTSGVSSLSQPNGLPHSLGSQGQTTAVLEANQTVPSVSQFTFDLNFFKSQLNKMNCMGQDRFNQPKMQKGFGAEGSLFARSGTPSLLNSRSRSSNFYIPDTDLALQL